MKRLQNISLLAILLLSLFACDITDPLDVEPTTLLSDSNAVVDAETAENALVGAYYNIRLAFNSTVWGSRLSAMGVEADNGTFLWNPHVPFFMNEIPPADDGLLSIYRAAYQLINDANHVIEKTAVVDSNLFENNRKDEILGEAYFLRALINYKLLTTFGQFWNINSEFGIVINEGPSSINDVYSRSSVSETYDFILQDLENAINMAPDYTNSLIANKLAAKAIKARVLLFRGENSDYTEAANLALDVINNSSGATLENNYDDIFIELFDSEEVLFSTFVNSTTEGNSKGLFWSGVGLYLSQYYLSVLSGDPREALVTVPYAYNPAAILNKKYNNGAEFSNSEPEYFIRLAEVHLIRAEALARSGASPVDVRNELNVVRNRVGAAPSTSNDINILKEDIRLEVIKELATENGRTWFDLIRYAVLDGLDISTIKPSVTSESQYIMPIPSVSIDASNGTIIQNPDY